MHLSLKGSLKSGAVLTYVKTDQALDLGNLEPFTIPDLSGNANTATLNTGIYVSTNGTTDKAIGANATALGSGNYYLTGKIKPAGTTAKTTMNGSTASNLTGLTAGVWQDFQTATASAITPGSINLGWDGTAFNATVDNWSDVKLHDASDDSVVASWKLYDSADASLDGYPALDCVGGYHGAHVGCAGGSGEGVDPDVAGISATLDDYMYFDGADDRVEISNTEIENITFTTIFTGVTTAKSLFFGSTASHVIVTDPSGRFGLFVGFYRLSSFSPSIGVTYTINLQWNGSGYDLTVNGASEGAISSSKISINSIGRGFNSVSGLLYDVTINEGESNEASYQGYGNTNADWLDQIGSNDGTVNGSPVTVGQKRETILQTAGEDFNNLMWFDGVDDYISLGGGDALSLDGASKIEWRGWIYYDGSTPSVVYSIINQPINLTTAGFSVVINDINSIRVAGRSVSTDSFQSLSTPITKGWHYIKAYSDIAGDQLGISIDNGAYVTSSATFANGTYTNGTPSVISAFGDILNIPNTEYIGIIGQSELLIDDVQTEHWAATGNTDADWVSTGSANGTVNGSPSLYNVAESETTAGQDALGTAIENPRPNERVLNLTTGTGYAEIADSVSLDLTTAATWEMWIDFEEIGSPQAILAKYTGTGNQRSYYIAVAAGGLSNKVVLILSGNGLTGTSLSSISLPATVAQVVFAYESSGVVAYVNGSSVSVTLESGTVPASIFTSTAPLEIGAVEGINLAQGQIGDVRIYDRALTADEVLKNYNARKSAYGL